MKRLMPFLFAVASRALVALGVRRTIRLGRRAGLLVFHCLPIRRRIVLENLAQAFPEKTPAEHRRIARDVYRQLGRVLAEIVLLPRLPLDALTGLVRMHDTELLDSALKGGSGAIVCMGHMGNWELVGYEGRRRGYDVCAITKQLKGALNQSLHDARRDLFRELAPRNSVGAALTALRGNAALALVIDQHQPGRRAVVVDFFGRPAATSPAAAVINLRSGAPVLAAWMTLGADDVYDIWIRGPFPVPDVGTQDDRIQAHTQALTRDLESFIRMHPAEWFWVHRRWKVPASSPNVAAEGAGERAASPSPDMRDALPVHRRAVH